MRRVRHSPAGSHHGLEPAIYWFYRSRRQAQGWGQRRTVLLIQSPHVTAQSLQDARFLLGTPPAVTSQVISPEALEVLPCC